MMLAAALMLGEGLGERAAAESLSAAVARTPLPESGHSTARFGDRVPGRAAAEPALRVRGRRRMKMTGADAILRSLEAEGVDVAFGLPGGAILPTYDAFAKGSTVRHVLARHEQGAGHMAEGYARASGRVGVAIATSGPGATNLVTPIADAWMDSTPLVCITGQVRSHLIGTDAFQECDITGITIPIVKHSWLVGDVREIPEVIKAAFHVARTGRCGPVLVDIPRDVQEAEIDFAYPDHVDLPGWRPPHRVHRRQIQEAAKAIASAERPILYVGGGVLNAHATDELRELAEVGRLPVVTTLMAKGAFPESHGLFFGWPGMHGPKWSNWALNKADLVVAVGARFDDRVTGKLSAFAPGATVVHLDIDAAEIDKLRRADVPVVGPLKEVLAALAHHLGEQRRDGSTDAWLVQIARWREEFPLKYGNGGGMLKPQLVLETLQSLTAASDDEVVWTTGVGQHQMWAMQYLECDTPRSFITSGGLGTMGYGIPAAIGAKAARPDATVVCVDGDGCFQMTCQELATSVLERLPIVVVIVNNGHLGMVRQWQDMFFEERFSQVNLTHHLPDYAALADAYGAKGFVAEDEDTLTDALEQALACGRTAVVDCRVDPRRALLPDDPGRRGGARPRRVPVRRREGHRVTTHTLAVLVENKPGALTRITTMFARRGFNIESLAVGPTERHDISRITLCVECDENALAQIQKQMHKLVNVLRITELPHGESLERELALIKVTAPPERRAELTALRDVFAVRVVDVGSDALVFEICATPEEIDSFEELLRPHGIKEVVRTGRVALGRASNGSAKRGQLVLH